MRLRPNIQTPDRRIRAGLVYVLIGVVFERFGPQLPGLADSAFWNGLVHGVSVVFLAFGIYLSVSGASALARRP